MNSPHVFGTPPSSFASRRAFLARAGSGCGLLALATLLQEQGLLAAGDGMSPDKLAINPMAPRSAHFPAKAKRVIWLFMNGGPSQVDTWDYKPELAKRDGQELPGFDKNTGFFTDQVGASVKSPFEFRQHGQSGAWASEIFPKMAEHVEDMAFLHSCYTKTMTLTSALFKIIT